MRPQTWKRPSKSFNGWSMSRVLEVLRQRFEQEPYAKKFGIKIIDLKEGYSLVEMVVAEDMENIFNMAHGGAVFSVIDAAFELAGNSGGDISVALSMNVSYTRPAKAGDTLRAEAIETNSTRKTGLYEIKVKNQDEKLVASCQAIVYRMGKPLPWLEEGK
jgi:acyl-CoA thioesterase